MRPCPVMRYLLTGARLSMAGFAAKAALLLTLGIALFFGGKGAQIAHAGDVTALRPLLETAAAALLWGPGVLLAFPTALRAFVEDSKDGTRALVLSRGGSESSYLVFRIGGLAFAMATTLGAGALFVSVACLWGARASHVVGVALAGCVAAVVHVTLGSAVVATVAFAAVGARTRTGGYVRFLAWLAIPGFALTLVGAPAALREIGSVDEALATLRTAISHASPTDIARGLRAGVASVGWIALAWTVAKYEARRARVDAEAA